MVNSITGILTSKSHLSIGLENAGIEWAIETSATTLSLLPQIGTEVRIYTFLHHTQDTMRLYGFQSIAERTLFLALISVGGVGPALAKKILSGTTPQLFHEAMEREDVESLARIPGLGKKTAQKIVLQLRGKLTEDKAETGTSETQEVIEALAAMGFDTRSASKAVSSILADPQIGNLASEEREKEILRRAIVYLSQ